MADRYGDITAGLIRFGLRQERRVMRLKPQASQIEWTDDQTLVLQFELPKGTYATTVLRELIA
jgi:tRNA pseudouridine13 synthase